MPPSGPTTPSHSRPRTPHPVVDSGSMAGIGAHGRKSHDSGSRHSHERATNDADTLSSATSASTSSSMNTSANASTGSSPSRGHQPFYYPGAMVKSNTLPTAVPALLHPNTHPNLLRKPHPTARRNSFTLSPLDTGVGASDEIGRRPNTANVTAERGRSFDRPGPPERPARSLDRKRSASLGRHESRSRGMPDLQSSAPPPPLPSLPDGLATASPNSAAANANAIAYATSNPAPRGRSAAPAPPSNLERARSVATQSGSSKGASRSKRAPSQPRAGDKNQTEEISVHIMDGRGRRAYYPWAMDVLRDLKSPLRD